MQLFNSLYVLHFLPIPYEDHGQQDRYRYNRPSLAILSNRQRSLFLHVGRRLAVTKFGTVVQWVQTEWTETTCATPKETSPYKAILLQTESVSCVVSRLPCMCVSTCAYCTHENGKRTPMEDTRQTRFSYARCHLLPRYVQCTGQRADMTCATCPQELGQGLWHHRMLHTGMTFSTSANFMQIRHTT
jgi:hypothetical protein